MKNCHQFIKTFFLLFILISNLLPANAQDVPFNLDNFPGKNVELQNALLNIEKGDAVYYQQPPLYQLAILDYIKAQLFNGESAELNYKLGVCYLNSNDKYKAFEYIKKAWSLNPTVDPMIHYYLGRCHQLNLEWDNAIDEYNQFLVGMQSEEKRKAAYKRIEECTNGKELMKKPLHVKIENLGTIINTPFPEYTPLISADESVLFFTSRREDTFGGEVDPDQQQYFEDIYKSSKVGGKWVKAKNLGPPVNTKSHDAGAGLSLDGHTMFVFKGDKNSGDILVSKLVNGVWIKPEDAGRNINTKFHESSACLSPDGNTLYFVSDKPGGHGGRDIYKSRWDDHNKIWLKAENLGDSINTSYDEEGVFMHPDGRTLYFSSQAHTCMGGYDIFYSSYINNAWSAPVNIGYPVNTADDDVFFEVSADNKHGYYASVRKEGYGEKDIYLVTFLKDEKPLSKMSILKGVIRNAVTREPLAANIELIDLEKSEHIGNFTTDSKTGQYLISLPAGRNYGAVAYSEGFLFESDHFNIADTSSYSEINMDIEMKPMTEGNNIVLTNIFFDSDKFDLKNESKDILDRVIKLMRDFPAWKVEISGHTDNIGSVEYNQRLSESRAKSVVDYLITEGISKDRLTYVGYGESRPFTSNETNDGKQKNRRIEFKITGK